MRAEETNFSCCNILLKLAAGKTYNVCVCEKHQNVKLMIDAVCRGKIHKYLFMEDIVSEIKNHDCMMKVCTRCPKYFFKQKLIELLDNRGKIKKQLKT